MTWAMEQQLCTDPNACSVLMALANHADRDGTASFPSVETLRRYTKLSERTIRAKLAALEQSGMIRRGNQAIAAAHIARADQRPVVWDLAMERGIGELAPEQADGVRDLHPATGTGCKSGVNGVQMTSERGARAAPEPSFNHKATGIYTAGARESLNEPSGDSGQFVQATDQVGTFEGHGNGPFTPAATAPTPAGAIAVELRRRGYRITSHSPELAAALAEGVTLDAIAEFADLYPADHPKCRGSPGYVLSAARRQHAETAEPIATATATATAPRGTHATDRPGHRESAVERVARRIHEAEERDAAAAALPHALAADG